MAPGYAPDDNRLGFARQFLVVWRDRFFTPWPAPLQPFDRAARRELEIQIDFVRQADLQQVRQDRESKGWTLFSWGVRGPGGENVHFALNWIHQTWQLQERTFVMTGPGNLEDAYDAQGLRFVGDVPAERVDRAVLPWLQARNVGLGAPQGPRPRPPRPDPRPSGPGPDFGAKDGPDLPTLDNAPTHPFDLLMWRWMRALGVRAAQLCVNRHGELRFSRAYTWAENGYPITKTFHRMRNGSVAKPHTAMLLGRHYMRQRLADPDDLGLDHRLGPQLGIYRQEPGFGQITLRQALSHYTGLDQDQISAQGGHAEIVLLNRPDDELPGDADGPFGDYVPRPGEMRIALQDWPEDLIVLPPDTPSYNNYVYISLSELWSSIWSGTSDWGIYDQALRESLLELASVDVAQAMTGVTYAQCNSRHEVAYHAHFLHPFRSDPDQPEHWEFYTYPRYWPFYANMALSMREQARVLALLTPRDGTEPFMSIGEKWILAGRPADGSIVPPLGWDLVGKRNLVPLGGAQNVNDTMIHVSKNGGGSGTAGWITHWFPGPYSTLDENITVDFAFAFNLDIFNMDIAPIRLPDDLLDAAIDVEARGLWSPVDLTGGSDYDEEP